MPPWHIDKTVGIQEFKNDRSLSDEQIDDDREVDRRRRAEGRPEGHAGCRSSGPTSRAGTSPSMFGQNEPDLIIQSTPWTQKAGANDAWWKPVVEPASPNRAGCARLRFVRAPSRAARSRITPSRACSRTKPIRSRRTTGSERRAAARHLHGMGRRQAGRDDAAELRQADAARLEDRWDIHYSNGGEDITDIVELGIYFYPKGQEPKFRQVLHLMGATNAGGVDIPPNTVKATEGFFVMRENGRVESFQPHMHLRGKAMTMEAILPNGQTQVLSYVSDFNFNWHNSYVYADDAAPLLPKGTIIKVTAWHDNTAANKANPDPNVVGRLRRPHGGRDGARVGQRHLHGRRRLQGRARRAPQGAAAKRRRSSNSSSTPAAAVARGRIDSMNPRRRPVRRAAPFLDQETRSMRGIRVAVATLRLVAVAGWIVVGVGQQAPDVGRRAAATGAQPPRRSVCAARPIYPGIRRLGTAQGRHQRSSCIGYYNRNKDQTLDIPIGPNNRIEPGGPDMGSRRISSRAATTACSRSRCRRISATRS